LDFSVLLILGLIFLFGYMGGLLSNRIGLPKVSGYVLTGIILSPSVTGIITSEFLKSSSVIVDFALAMVGFDLGGSLRWNKLKKHKTSILFITLGQGAGAFISVMLGTFIFMTLIFPAFLINDIFLFSIIFGALSLSTAPAATMAIIHEYRAKGTFTSTLLAVVALDDALGILVFALTLAFIKVLVLGSNPSFSSFTEPVLNLIFSTLLGMVVGLAAFFVLAGAHIDISLFIEYLPLAIVFVIFRLSGKWIGSFIGGNLSAAPKNISRYIGFGLSPQAGIAIGLALYLQRMPALEKYSVIALNVIIAKTAINEIIGPYLLKFALKKTGEARK
jgi:Kef-type K+ transport system membrane component KefB